MARFQVVLLGEFRLLADGRPIVLPVKARMLIGFLATLPLHRASRLQISGVLWPEIVDSRALGNLSTCLWRVRKSIGSHPISDLIEATPQQVALNTSKVEVDCWEFETAAERVLNGGGDMTEAARTVDLYTGDLLHGTCDDNWVIAHRERLRILYVQVLHYLARMQARGGLVGQAVGSYERLIKEDPSNEQVCRELMQLYAATGNRGSALRVFELVSRYLREELNVTPESETVQLCDMLRKNELVAGSGSDAICRVLAVSSQRKSPMVGRDEEMAELRKAVQETAAGKLLVIGVEGEAGIGKTRLVQEFACEARAEGHSVFITSCDERERSLPYQVFIKLIDATVADPAPEVLSGAGMEISDVRFSVDNEHRVRLYEWVGKWFSELARSAPALVVVEDVYLADAASLDLLSYLIAHYRRVKNLIILTWRREECPAKLQRLVAERCLIDRVISLSRLSEADVWRLCSAFIDGGHSARALSRVVFRESEGNPLFVVEMLRSVTFAQPDGLLSFCSEDGWETRRVGNLSSDIIPASIRSAIRRRVQHLRPGARRLLYVASACGRKLDLDILRRFLNVEIDEIVRRLRALVGSGFVTVAGESYEFAHEKVRLFCYAMIPPRMRLCIHRDVLNLLEQSHPDRVDELAFHSESCGEVVKAASYWKRIAERALRLWAYRDAAEAYSKALLHVGGGTYDSMKDRLDLLAKRASVWEVLGEIARCEADIREILEAAATGDFPLERCHAITLHSRLLIRRGYYHQAVERARQALKVAQDLGDSRLEARAREALALSLYRSNHDEDARRIFLELLPTLERLDDRDALERVWNRIASLQASRGDSLVLSSLDAAERFWAGDLSERGLRGLLRGTVLAQMGRFDEARVTLQQAEKDYRRCGSHTGVALANGLLAMVYGCHGDYALAIKHARRGLPLRAGKTDAHWRVIASTSVGHGLLIGIGGYKMVRRMVMRVLGHLPQIDGRSKGNLLDLAAVIALEEGDLDLSYDLIRAALQGVSASPGTSKGEFLVTLGRIKLAQRRTEEAVAALRESVAILETGFNYVDFLQALSFLAMALKDAGEWHEAAHCSERAVNLLTSHGDYAYRPQEIYWNHYLVMRDHKESVALHALSRAYRVVTRRASHLGARMRRRYLSTPLNRAIVETWEKTLGKGRAVQVPVAGSAVQPQGAGAPERVTVLIPRTGAPWGRPLRAEEYVEVIWTLDAGRQDEALKEIKGEVGLRRARILRLCAEANVQGGDPREEDLARVLGVSTRTIRADIAWLRAQGCSLQTRGANLH